MKLKLAIAGRLSYCFCGRVALRMEHTVKSPLEVDLDTLNDQEILSLVRAVRTKSITVVEGEKELLEKGHFINEEKKPKRTVVPTEIKETTPVELKEEEKPAEAESILELNEDPILEEKPVEVKKPTTRKKTTKVIEDTE